MCHSEATAQVEKKKVYRETMNCLVNIQFKFPVLPFAKQQELFKKFLFLNKLIKDHECNFNIFGDIYSSIQGGLLIKSAPHYALKKNLSGNTIFKSTKILNCENRKN
jgi:hypothetical protein